LITSYAHLTYFTYLLLQQIKCETKKTKKGDDDDNDKCTTKKTKDKRKVRNLAHSSPTTSSTIRSSPEPTLCREETDTTGDGTTDPDPRLPETLPGDITPSPTGARRTQSPTAAAATPAPTPTGEDEPPRGEDVPETEKLPETLPSELPPPDSDETIPEPDETTVPPITPDPTYSPTEAFPTYAPTSSKVETLSPTPKPTTKPTNADPDGSNETGFLGFTLVENTEYNLMVNAGLTIKRIAKKNQKVQFENGKESTDEWHLWMDGAAVIHLPKGGYAYVSNSEHDDGMGGVYGLYLNDDHEVTGYKKLMGKSHIPALPTA
jgi:hypothetical protein